MRWRACGIACVGLTMLGLQSAAQQPPPRRPRPPLPVATQVGPAVTTLAQQPRQMPNLVGLTIDEARQALSRIKVVPRITIRDTQDQKLDGRVAAQRPNAGTALPNTTTSVDLLVHRYVPDTNVTVPSVIGRDLAGAVVELQRARLQPSYPGRIGPLLGTVTAQEPGAGAQVPAGSVVALTLALLARVPDVTGLDVLTAEQRLLRAGLTRRDAGSEYSDQVEAGRVVRQHPERGATMPPGSAVELWISLGQHPVVPVLLMPQVVGLTLVQAEQRLASVKLRLAHIDEVVDAARAGRVVAQTPAEGVEVHRGDAVTVQLAVAPTMRTVPRVVGLAVAEASARLADSGFVARQRLVPVPAGTIAGIVTAQSVAAGQAMPPGSSVELTVGEAQVTPPQVRRMPNVIGLSEEAAREAVGFLSPTLQTALTATPDASLDGRVVSQEPAPGTIVVPELRVLLRVGRLEIPPPPPPQPAPRALVPPLVGVTLDSARRALQQAGLQFGLIETTNAAADSVIATQQPAAGTEVAPASAVSVTLVAVQLPPPPPPPPPPQPDPVVIPEPTDDDTGSRLPLLLALGAAVVIAATLWMKSKGPGPEPPPRPPVVITVRLEPSGAATPKCEVPDDKSVEAFSVALSVAESITTITHADSLVAREEVTHERRA